MPAEKIQERSGLSENTERDHRPGLCLTDELELRFLGKPAGAWTDKGYHQRLPPQPLQAAEKSAGGQQSDPAFLSNWQSGVIGSGLFPAP